MILILGAGTSGCGAALLAKHLDFEVFVSDAGIISDSVKRKLEDANIAYEEGGHSANLLEEATEIIKSPGINWKVPLVAEAVSRKIPIIDELEFAFRYTRARIIAITGSNGKTTTTLLTYHLLKESGLNVCLAGNIGFSLAESLILKDYDWVVLEVSSFQLEGMVKFRPDVAVITNITPDHLDRYDYQMEKYVDAKFRIIKNLNPEGVFITMIDSEPIAQRLKQLAIPYAIKEISSEHKVNNGAWLDKSDIVFSQSGETKGRIPLAEIPLQGKHNFLNTMAAVLAATYAGLSIDKIRAAIGSFVNHPHRLEKIGVLNGVEFVNDSKATNVDSVKYALDAYEGNIIWIAGGIDKGNDYDHIAHLVESKVKALVCMGKDNSLLIQYFQSKVSKIANTNSLEEAIDSAISFAEPGDTVLLSPACASFDLFKNYGDRGDKFREAVKQRLSKQSELL